MTRHLSARLMTALAFAMVLGVATPAWAHGANDDATSFVRPPVLLRSVAPGYPAGVPASRGVVEVTLTIELDTNGRVVRAKVSDGTGPPFDTAALSAARELEFEPARRGGAPTASEVDFVITFVPPPESTPQPPPEPTVVPSAKDVSRGPTTLVLAARPTNTATERNVGHDEIHARPVRGASDLLRVTPGLVVAQHSGGGKASQYFLRGFDADHGTDVALSLDDVPINMVSHAHGQGYADTNFVIPEMIDRLEVRKGPYYPQFGNFATAGVFNWVSRDALPHSSMGIGFETSPGHGSPSLRSLMSASPRFGPVQALLAVDVARENGPFERPNEWDRYRVFDKVTVTVGKAATLSASFAGYAGNWNGSGQIPARAVERGQLSRFGAIDSGEGGSSARHQLSVAYRAELGRGDEFSAVGYLARYRLALFSNFTLFLEHPEGDQIEQDDRRVLYGMKLAYRFPRQALGMTFETTLGMESRSDDIEVELWNTRARQRIAARRQHEIDETMTSVFVNERWKPTHWLRYDLGARADLLAFSASALRDEASFVGGRATATAAQFSPKASAVLDLVQTSDLLVEGFVNYGHGFHSNDVRSVVVTRRATPLARAVGAEVGSRLRLSQVAELSLAAFQLDLQSELLWSGDLGTTEAVGATRRRGIELEGRYRISRWLWADLSYTLSRAEMLESDALLPLAPSRTWSGGLRARGNIGPGKARAAWRFFGLADRPASDDGALVAQGFTQFDLAFGYTLRWIDVGLDVENLFNGAFRSAQFATTSRLAYEPTVGQLLPADFRCGAGARLSAPPDPSRAGRFFGCEDLHFTPAYPLTVRAFATVFLD